MDPSTTDPTTADLGQLRETLDGAVTSADEAIAAVDRLLWTIGIGGTLLIAAIVTLVVFLDRRAQSADHTNRRQYGPEGGKTLAGSHETLGEADRGESTADHARVSRDKAAV